jgi:hypothetical protein
MRACGFESVFLLFKGPVSNIVWDGPVKDKDLIIQAIIFQSLHIEHTNEYENMIYVFNLFTSSHDDDDNMSINCFSAYFYKLYIIVNKNNL